MILQHRTPFRLAAVVLVASCAALNAAETDERIISAARGSYNFMTYLQEDKINLACKGGAVTLTGKV